jgi:phosphotriesterase-related protein
MARDGQSVSWQVPRPDQPEVSGEVMTVLGPVSADVLGVTLPHEHLVVNAVRLDAELLLDDLDLAIAEARRFRDAGGGAIVELSNRGLGRNPLALQRIAQETGLHIIMGCGWYHEHRYERRLWEQSTNEIADEMIQDLTVGADGTTVRAGIIGEVGCARDYVSPVEERVLRAAARAQRQTNRSIITHGDFSPIGLAQLDIFAEEGVDPRRVIVSHCDSCPDPAYFHAVATRGAYVEFDLIRGNNPWEDQRHVGWIRDLVTRGFLRQILLSHDVCKPRHLHAYGGFGYDHLLSTFVPELQRAGFSDEQLRVLLVENPKVALTGLQA